MDQIENFIEGLSRQAVLANTVNLYRGKSRESEIRRHNLYCYLKQMIALKPEIMFLGEAPGYNGARYSGLAFTSEQIINDHPFFTGQNFRFINEPPNLRSELSANTVWRVLNQHDIQPLIWNIFPFHPHKPGRTHSNRTPTMNELRMGRQFTLQLLEMFEIRHIVSLGRKAESQMNEIHGSAHYVRHPAQGGAIIFAEGINNLLTNVLR